MYAPVTTWTATTGRRPFAPGVQYNSSGVAAAVGALIEALRDSLGAPQFAMTCTSTTASSGTTGICTLICVGLTNVRKARRPPASTHASPRTVGRTPLMRSLDCTARAVPAIAKFEPKTLARPPGEMAVTGGALPAPPITPPEEIAGASVGAAATVSSTLTVNGDPADPGAVTVTVPAYVPGARVAPETDTCRFAGPEPLAGVTFSQPPPVAVTAPAVQAPVLPVIFSSNDCAAGGEPPGAWRNDSAVGAAETAPGGVTVTSRVAPL